MMLAAAGPALAAGAKQQPASVERAGAPRTAPVPQTTPRSVALDQDASATRESFDEVLRRLPPGVSRVMRIDPSLMGNETYLSTYPALANFLSQHPEVRNDPSYFLEHVRGADFYAPPIESAAVQVWRDILQFIGISSVFLTIALLLIWILKTIVEYRRWNRTTKIHTDVSNKLLDRFTNNEDLLAYIQSPVGRKFMEATPMPVDTPARPVGAPFSRILWSVQIGVVIAAAAIGLLFVSNRVVVEVSQPLFALGILGLALGTGFIVSAAASYALSRQLGLLHANEQRLPTD